MLTAVVDGQDGRKLISKSKSFVYGIFMVDPCSSIHQLAAVLMPKSLVANLSIYS